MPINLAAAGLRVRVLGALQVAVDGRPIVVGGSARRVLALLATRPGLDPDSWVRRACAIAGRELTRDEWNELLPGRAYRPVCAGGSPVGRLGDTPA